MKSLLRIFFNKLCRLYPLKSGCGLFANTDFFKAISQTAEALTLTKLRDGSLIYVSLDQYIGRSIYYFGDFDPKITWVCRQVLRRGDTVLDIGANIGIVTLYTAKLVGSSGKVHAFEPQPKLAQLLQKSVALNHYTQVTLHELALSSQDGIVKMQVPIANDGAASLEKTETVGCNEIEIEIKQANTYLSNLQIKQVRLLKIDVEGHESIVFKSSEDFLLSCKPDIILFEEHNKPLLQQDSVKILQGMDYIIYEMPKAMFRVKPQKLMEDSTCKSHDCIAIHKDAYNSALAKALNIN
jgi:FkbM family methyltransferase